MTSASFTSTPLPRSTGPGAMSSVLSAISGDSTASLRDIYLAACDEHKVTPNSSVLRHLPAHCGFSVPPVLDLSGNYVGNGGFLALLPVIARCPQLTTVLAPANGLRNTAVFALAGILATHPALVAVDISGNVISDAAAAALLAALAVNPRVRRVVLRDTRVGVDIQAEMKRVLDTRAATEAHASGSRGHVS
eukprot:TRINITY_DN23751_c0_g1_i1.p1 TRINITY_DN23751_c0_g1~~TRINITY_DN23751_c0_g1_i1.p1  ORF type:complete len:192 (+),score=16.13 TRINITY_DN23751_c0_g1_i1:55-630(+)